MSDSFITNTSKEVSELARLLKRLLGEAPSRNEREEFIKPTDIVELTLVVGELGSGRYKASVVKECLSSGNSITAPTRLPATTRDGATAILEVEQTSRFKPPVWRVSERAEPAAKLCRELELSFREAASLALRAPRERVELAQSLREASPVEGRDGRPTGEGTAGEPEGDAPHGSEDAPSYGASESTVDPGVNRRSERSGLQTQVDNNLAAIGSGPDSLTAIRRGTLAQWEYLKEKSRSLSERLLFLHLLRAKQNRIDYGGGADAGWITVSSEKLEEKMLAPERTESVWKGSELVEAYKGGWFSYKEGLAREFRIPSEVLRKWTELGTEGARRYVLYKSEKTLTGQPVPLQSRLYDSNRNELPELQRRAIEKLSAAEHVIRLGPIEEAMEELAERGTAKARDRLSQLRQAYHAIKRQVVRQEGEISYLQNAFQGSTNGRILFRDTGPVGLPGAVKERAYDINGLRNWDIESCHTNGLYQLAEDLGEVGVEIDTAPLDAYLGRGGKDWAASKLDLPRGLVKAAEHGIKYLMLLPSGLDHASAMVEGSEHLESPSDIDIVDAVIESSVGDVSGALGKLREQFLPMRKMCSEMARELVTTYYDEHKQRGSWAMRNAAGVPFKPGGLDRDSKAEGMGWYLQGLESSFVLHLTLLAEEYDYEVISNEHDGAPSIGKIPEEAQERAAQRSGFTYATLVEKPWADQEEVEELYGSFDDEPATRSRETAAAAPLMAPDRKSRRRKQRPPGSRSPAVP